MATYRQMTRNDRDTSSKIKDEVIGRLAGKVSKEDSNYRPSNHGNKEECSECLNYLQPGDKTSSCRVVAGLVYATDVCDLYRSRSTEGAPAQPAQAEPQKSPIMIEVNINARRTP